MRSGRSANSSRKLPPERHGLEVGVAGDEQEAVPGLQEVGGGRDGVGAGDEVEERVVEDLGVALVEEERHGSGGLRHHAHGAIDDGVLGEAFAGEGGVVARRPYWRAQGLEAEEGAGAARFGVGGATIAGGVPPTVGIPPTPNPSPQGGGDRATGERRRGASRARVRASQPGTERCGSGMRGAFEEFAMLGPGYFASAKFRDDNRTAVIPDVAERRSGTQGPLVGEDQQTQSGGRCETTCIGSTFWRAAGTARSTPA